MDTQPRGGSIATRLLLLQLLSILALVVVVLTVVAFDSRAREEEDAAQRALAIAVSIAENPFVLESLPEPDPSAVLQPYAASFLDDGAIDFVTIMLPDRTRLTHPDPDEIGLPFRGTIAPALTGASFTETFPGTLGPSVRAVVPVTGDDGEIVALVAAGTTISSISETINARLPLAIAFGSFAALLAAAASWLLSRFLRRATWGRGPEQISQMFSYYESVLHSVREGLVLVDTDARIVLYNDQAAEMLGLPGHRTDDTAILVATLEVPASLRDVLASGDAAVNEIHLTDSQVLVVNQEPAIPSGRFSPRVQVGTVTSLRDHTEVTRLTGELRTTRILSDALRSQTHEFANRLHTIVSLIELGRAEEALDLATSELAVSQRLADQVMAAVSEPVLAALLLGKSAQAAERGIEFSIDGDSRLETTGIAPVDLVTVLGNLIDNAFDAASQAATGEGDPAWVEVYLANTDDGDGPPRLVVQVSDSGPGLTPEHLAEATERGVTSKPPGEFGRGVGLALVRQTVRRTHGSIRSSVEGGSSIVVELPLAPGVAPAAVAP